MPRKKRRQSQLDKAREARDTKRQCAAGTGNENDADNGNNDDQTVVTSMESMTSSASVSASGTDRRSRSRFSSKGELRPRSSTTEPRPGCSKHRDSGSRSSSSPGASPLVRRPRSSRSRSRESRSSSSSSNELSEREDGDYFDLDLAKEETLTRFEKKLLKHGREDDDLDPDVTEGRLLVDFFQVCSLINSFPCPQCFSFGTMTTEVKERRGQATHVQMLCTECGKTVNDWWSSVSGDDRRGRGKKPYQVYRASVFASLSCGMGATSFRNFCEQVDLPAMHHKSFQDIAEKMYSESDKVRRIVFSKAAETVRREHAKLDPAFASPETVLDIAVSYDGSWLTRPYIACRCRLCH